MSLLEVENLRVDFPVRSQILRRRIGAVHAVRGVDLSVQRGECLAIVGESGSGKSTLARAIGRLLPASGRAILDGKDLLALSRKDLRGARRNLQYVFQDPYSSLNRRWRIEDIVAEPLVSFGVGDRAERRARVLDLLEMVGLDRSYARHFPRELSGGQRQRVGIARALALNPRLVVCDEAVSALDVSVQAQILNLLSSLRTELGLAFLFITHDLGIVRRFADRVAVMHAGQVVELTTARDLFNQALHPYSAALLSAVPTMTMGGVRPPRIRLAGGPPSPLTEPPGCLFASRCPTAIDMCRTSPPPQQSTAGGGRVACHLVESSHAVWRQPVGGSKEVSP